MRKLITGAIVAAALAVPATPAFAIHDGTGMPGAVCSNPDSRAVGNNPNPGTPNIGVSNSVAGTESTTQTSEIPRPAPSTSPTELLRVRAGRELALTKLAPPGVDWEPTPARPSPPFGARRLLWFWSGSSGGRRSLRFISVQSARSVKKLVWWSGDKR